MLYEISMKRNEYLDYTELTREPFRPRFKNQRETMNERDSGIRLVAEKTEARKTNPDEIICDEENQSHNKTAKLEKSQNIKPKRDISKTTLSRAYGDKERHAVQNGEPADENSEYFSKLGEIGTSNIMSLRSKELHPEDIEELWKMFGVFDQDGNGVITANELRTIMSSLGQSTTEAEVMDMVNSIGKIPCTFVNLIGFLAKVFEFNNC